MINETQKVSFFGFTLYKISQKPNIKQIIGQLKGYLVQNWSATRISFEFLIS